MTFQATTKFMNEHPEFIGFRRIVDSYRTQTKDTVAQVAAKAVMLHQR